MKSIIIIIDYFGIKWPEWFPIYLESCRKNPTITWLFHTNCDHSSFNIENVIFSSMTKEEYIKNVNQKLGINFPPDDNYKICDLRPAYGELYEEEIRGYDFFGYGDIDLLYGDIRKFYNDEVLKNNVISTLTWCFSGHLTLIRNTQWLRRMFRRITNWRSLLEKDGNQTFDENIFIKAFRRYPPFLSGKLKSIRFIYDIIYPATIRHRRGLYLKEQFTTPLTHELWLDGTFNHPEVWFWKDGHVTNNKDENREFIYIHFMNYKHPRSMDAKYGNTAFWDKLPKLVHLKTEDITKGVRIDRYGFHKMD
ncbi:MAG: hypothetical protein CVU55_02400 [Deltaproteobacteria bacterium HGW-Deltaproteobacteria-13]|nr:MAG: hypothetical protein CVU55_02400 [Deltaproteobacteria bacterium HGW-Deltaproteobacteria-13]